MEAEPFYDEYAPQEWERLGRHRTEFGVSLRAIHEFLPQAPCSVLDVGGGPGRYAIELARQGYQVTLVDLSRENLKIARQKAGEAQVSLVDLIHANALDLSVIGPASFSAVLLMGPLYHLLSFRERVQAIHEARRVLQPGGRLFAAFITRFAPFRYMVMSDPAWLAENPAYALQLLETGIHDNPTGFAKAYYVHPNEVAPLMEGCGLRTLSLVGCEGVLAEFDDQVSELTGKAWEAWVDLNYKLGQDPALYGASDHLLYVGEKFD
ncbi:MAG: class I SAM-dependent methyltransferase [Anaerolineales bacterium]|nr:class I SAM-dependent methyltransferase [Anaerolineales bacterium]